MLHLLFNAFILTRTESFCSDIESMMIYPLSQTAEISHESPGCGQCLLEYLLERLQVESCHVKLKVRTALLSTFLSVICNVPCSQMLK